MDKKQLLKKRAALMREAEALKGTTGTFATDEARAEFDAKMADIERIDEQIRALDPAPAPAPAQSDDTAEQTRATERARVLEIQRIGTKAKLDAKRIQEFIDKGTSLDEVRIAAFEELAGRDEKTETNSPGGIRMGEDAQDKFMRGVGNWLIVKGGMADTVQRAEKAKTGTATAIDAGEFRGMTLVEIARDCLVRAGHKVQGLSKMDLVARAFTTRGSITQSTSDFTTILENVMHKVLLAAYAITPDTWSRFCKTGTVSDFRAHNRYRMGTFGSLDAVNQNGEFKRKAIEDGSKEAIAATTKGNIINVSRQMIVNDDMGAFTDLLSKLGRAAKLSVEVDVYALLAQNSGDGPTMDDGIALFHASSHGANKTTGAALSAANLDLDRVAMASQRDPSSNEYLDLRPAILLVPVGLGGQARIINQSQYDPDTLANKSQMKPNLVAGLFRDIVDTPRISGTRRYLFADPSLAPVIEVVFLEGQTEPVLETKDGWDVDGTEMKVRYDYGVDAVDYRGAVSNAGQ